MTQTRELSLFTGAGGGLLGTHLLGWHPVAYVEIDDYCQRILLQRIKDGIIPKAPIFSDIKTFIDQGYAQSYQGMVDVITAGFPCQPFSVAGKQLGEKDERNMWPETLEAIRIVRPKVALLENVPGLLSRRHGYFEEILKDLAEIGYNAKWKIISAAELGAPHKRDRLFLLADANEFRCGTRDESTGREKGANIDRSGEGASLADNPCKVPDPDKSGCKEFDTATITKGSGFNTGFSLEKPSEVCNSTSEGLSNRTEQQVGRSKQVEKLKRSDWWAVEPELGRVAHGVANRVDRLKAIGNGQVPAVVREAWELLN